MNQIIKLGIGLAVAGLLTACGPDGDSGGGGEKGIISKGGECVKIGHSANKKGVFSRHSVIIPGAPESFIESKILENDGKVLKKSVKTHINPNDDGTTITEGKYYIRNNYFHLTESNMTWAQVGIDVTGTMLSTYDPYGIRTPNAKVCKGQIWIDSFTAKSVVYPAGENHNQTFNFIWGIEDINVEKTVVAGDFSTYILAQYADKEKKIIMGRDWIDIKNGFTIYSETYDNGQIRTIHELIKFKK